MYNYLFFLFFLLTSPLVLAQTTSLESLLDLSHRHQSQTAESVIFKGQPFVHIDETNGAPLRPKPSGWMDEEKIRLFGTTDITKSSLSSEPVLNPSSQENSSLTTSMTNQILTYIPDFSIQTPFNEETTASFIDHTTDFVILIQILNQKEISVEERIQFVNTDPNKKFTRTLSKQPSGIKNIKPAHIQLIEAQIDRQPLFLTQTETEKSVIFSNEATLAPGVHNVTLKYLVQNALVSKDDIGQLVYSLTGPNWPLGVERFSVLVLFPQKTGVFDKKLFFGSNNVDIPPIWESESDETGNTFFKLKRPLPAYAEVKLVETFDFNALPQTDFSYFLNMNLNSLSLMMGVFSLLFYLLISLIYFRFKKPEKKLLHFIYQLSPLTIRLLINADWDTNFLIHLRQVKQFKGKRTLFLSFLITLSHQKIIRILFFPIIKGIWLFLFLLQYWLTEGILIFLSIYLSKKAGFETETASLFLFILIAFLSLIILYQKGIKKSYQKELALFSKTLINSNSTFGLNTSAINALCLRYYEIFLSLKKENEWIKFLEEHHLETQSLVFLKRGKE